MAFGSLTQWWRSFSCEGLTFEKHKSSSEHSEDWSLRRGENCSLRKRLLRGEHRTAICTGNFSHKRWLATFSNKLCVRNSSYAKWELHSWWQLSIPDNRTCKQPRTEVFQVHWWVIMTVHVCFLFQCVSEMISVVLVQCRRYDGCMINFLIKWELCCFWHIQFLLEDRIL